MTISSQDEAESVRSALAVADKGCLPAYAAPKAEWVSLASALMAGDPSGTSDDIGDFTRSRPPRSKGAQRT